MERMVDRMHHLLERATGPMSFAVIVPGWDDEGCVSYQNMKSSRFARPRPGETLKIQIPAKSFLMDEMLLQNKYRVIV